MKKSIFLSNECRASIAFFAASVVSTGIAYLATPIYTRLLSSEEFGHVAVYSTWKQVLGIIAMFCLSYGVFNNGMADYPKQREKYSFSMLVLSNIITIISFILLCILYPMIGNFINLDLICIITMFTVFLFQPAYSFWTTKERYELRYKKTSLWTIICAIVSPLCSIILIISSNNHYLSRIIGAEIPLIIIYIMFYIYLGRESNWKVNTIFWKEALRFNLPLIPHYLSIYLLAGSDKIMISKMVGNEYTAYYTVAYTVASVALILWSSINATLVPYTYEHCKINDYKSISNIVLPILLVFFISCFSVVLLGPEIVSIMATNDYIEAVYVIPPVVGGVFFQVYYYLAANIIFYYKKPRYVMFASITSAVCNIILNALFIPIFGYIAAGYTTLFCYFLQAFIDFIIMKKITNSDVYDKKYIIWFSLIMIIVSTFGSVLYRYDYCRFFLLLIILMIVIIKRRQIKDIIFIK